MATSGVSDTRDEASRVQMELLRRASPARRAALARSLSVTVIDLSRRALAERWPEDSPIESRLRWVALHYGAELAEHVRRYLAVHPR